MEKAIAGVVLPCKHVGCSKELRFIDMSNHVAQYYRRMPCKCSSRSRDYEHYPLHSHILNKHRELVPIYFNNQEAPVTVSKNTQFCVLLQWSASRVFILVNEMHQRAASSISSTSACHPRPATSRSTIWLSAELTRRLHT